MNLNSNLSLTGFPANRANCMDGMLNGQCNPKLSQLRSCNQHRRKANVGLALPHTKLPSKVPSAFNNTGIIGDVRDSR